jgi:arsenate reductase (glutaredoxin)
MTLEYWHNPRCSKSRQGKELLDAAGAVYSERRYVDDAPTAKELDRVLTALGKEPWEIARMGEDVAKELDLASLPHDRKKWIDVMVANPILIERPILVTSDGRAALGRPPENLESLLSGSRTRP